MFMLYDGHFYDCDYIIFAFYFKMCFVLIRNK